MVKDIFLGILIIWNLMSLYFCFACDGCKNEHDVKMAKDSEESLFKKLLEKEAECECLQETVRGLKIETAQLQKQLEIKNEIIKRNDIIAKR